MPALVAVGGLMVLAAVVARGDSAVPLGEPKPLFGWFRLPNFLDKEATTPQPEPHGYVSDVSGLWATVVAWAILLFPLLVLVLAIVAAVVLSVRARKIQPPTPVLRNPHEEPSAQGDRAGALQRAARAAQQKLAEHAGGPPGNAVIAAWLELERVAAQEGTGKQAHQTPTEFTDTLLVEHAAIGRAVTQLRALYHRARYGRPGEVGPAEADAARRALDEITESMATR